MFKARKECETKIYKVMDILDPSGQNSAWYKKKFAKMNDKQFIEFFKQDFSIKFQFKLFEIEPKMDKISAALDYIDVPMMEKVNMPFLYRNKEGVPVKSDEALVVYTQVKRVKQFISKKNSNSTDITTRNMKDGLLLSVDKNGNTSDREFESLAVMGLNKTIKELATYRADSMNAKNEFYSNINLEGMVRMSDVDVKTADSLARNNLNVYLIGAGINSNLVNEGNYTPRTLSLKTSRTVREG